MPPSFVRHQRPRITRQDGEGRRPRQPASTAWPSSGIWESARVRTRRAASYEGAGATGGRLPESASASGAFRHASLPSYKPGVTPGRSAAEGPRQPAGLLRSTAIREALPAFEQARSSGFAMHDAVLTGVETRTSSPVRITRGRRRPQPQHRAACSRPAKARAMPAASCRRVSMASRWPRRWARRCWVLVERSANHRRPGAFSVKGLELRP